VCVYSFFEQAKMDYINIVVAVLSAKGISKRLLKKNKLFTQNTTRK